MSILIKGMEMPCCCDECRFLDEYGDYPCCIITDEQRGYNFKTREKRMDNCPLVPVPPHGELCDRTALINKIGENIDKAKDRNYDWWYACTVAYDFALAAPTIIPSEEE